MWPGCGPVREKRLKCGMPGPMLFMDGYHKHKTEL